MYNSTFVPQSGIQETEGKTVSTGCEPTVYLIASIELLNINLLGTQALNDAKIVNVQRKPDPVEI